MSEPIPAPQASIHTLPTQHPSRFSWTSPLAILVGSGVLVTIVGLVVAVVLLASRSNES